MTSHGRAIALNHSICLILITKKGTFPNSNLQLKIGVSKRQTLHLATIKNGTLSH
ncbi:Uncharacterised protein [Chlamydia trachomatis]|nr:Uncharacterised protein [Chlamydia trachomatis]